MTAAAGVWRRTSDLRLALDELARDGALRVRVDSGGALLGALLGLGLIDELSLLVHPIVVGPDAQRWTGTTAGTSITFELISTEVVDSDLVWLPYRLRHSEPHRRRKE